MKGVVKSFSRLKGYGFIQSEELEHEVFGTTSRKRTYKIDKF